MKTLLEYIDVVAEETSPINIILAVAELMRKEADASRETAKTSIFVFLDKLKNAGLPIDYPSLKGYYDADPRLSNVIQQFNDREIEFVGQGDEDEAPDTGAPVGEVPPEKKVNQMAKAALAKRESIGEDEYAALDSFTNNLNLSPEEDAKIAAGPDTYEADEKLMAKLMDHFKDEMPYGTQTGRDGDPYEFIFQELDNMGLIKEGLDEGQKVYRTPGPGLTGMKQISNLPRGVEKVRGRKGLYMDDDYYYHVIDNVKEEDAELDERKLDKAEKSKMKHYEKKIDKKDFIERYGKDRGEMVYYATITKMAKEHA